MLEKLILFLKQILNIWQRNEHILSLSRHLKKTICYVCFIFE